MQYSSLLLKTPFAIISFLLVVGCSDTDVDVQPPVNQQPQSSVYNGPAPQTEDIQKFKASLWDNISTSDNCGGCHGEDNQAPYFSRRDDVNLAYADTTPLVDLSSPDKSRLVEKVAAGHNCWLESDLACAETMIQWIKLWSDERVSIANTVELIAPIIREAGASKNFPLDKNLYTTHIYPLVREHCAECHDESADSAQSPFFASEDSDTAYQSAKRVINIDDTTQSRVLIRLRDDFHNCWSNCQENSAEILAALQGFSNEIPVDEISSDMVVSKALRLTDGVVASSGGRFETNAIALYQFKTGKGNTAYDTSGISPAANLTITGNTEWLGSWGIYLNNGKAQASTASSKKIHDLISATGEFTVEAWLAPNNVVQEGPARIISYSASDSERNFTLGQTQYNYDFMLRSEATSTNGEPALSTPDADEILQATLQHVVITYSASTGRKVYVNGKLIEIIDTEISPLASWDDSYALILGREATNNHVWRGSIRLLAIYNSNLTLEQIQQNYDVGVGEKFFLLFSIGEQIGLDNSYIVFEVSQFDNYSYLFNNPAIINLDGNSVPNNINIEGIKIGINGKESLQGQAYANVNYNLNQDTDISQPTEISRLGTIINLEKGSDQDEFFLTFERLGSHENIVVEGDLIASAELPAITETSHIGLRNFAEINASMSALTGIPAEQDKVFNTYQLVKRQLPSLSNIETFISAQQMGITQLAIAYCDRAMEDATLRSSWFPDLQFSASPNSALSQSERQHLIIPLIERFIPLTPANQPDVTQVNTELSNLIDRLSNCDENTVCDASRTLTISKASCAAVLASAVTLIQ